MEFFCYHRDWPGSAALRDSLREEHWSYMDRYAKTIARGPAFADDGDTPHRQRAHRRPARPGHCPRVRLRRAELPGRRVPDVLLRRWRDTLGRTRREFPRCPDGGNLYLVLGLGMGQAADLAVPPSQDELIAYGPLLSDDDTA